MKISLGCDHGGYALKEHIKAYLESKGHEVVDCGTYSTDSCDYPIFGEAAARKVQSGECERHRHLHHRHRHFHRRQQGQGHPLRAVQRAAERGDDPPPQQRQYARHGRRHDRQKYGRAHR